MFGQTLFIRRTNSSCAPPHAFALPATCHTRKHVFADADAGPMMHNPIATEDAVVDGKDSPVPPLMAPWTAHVPGESGGTAVGATTCGATSAEDTVVDREDLARSTLAPQTARPPVEGSDANAGPCTCGILGGKDGSAPWSTAPRTVHLPGKSAAAGATSRSAMSVVDTLCSHVRAGRRERRRRWEGRRHGAVRAEKRGRGMVGVRTESRYSWDRQRRQER